MEPAKFANFSTYSSISVPHYFFLVITTFITSFQVFAPIQIMTRGGPGTSTHVLVYYIYTSAFTFYRMGYASAMSWILFIILFAITMIEWYGQKNGLTIDEGGTTVVHNALKCRGMAYKNRKLLGRIIVTAIVSIFALTMIVPFLWMISASMKHPLDVMKLPIEWIPKYFYINNYQIVWNVGNSAPRDYHFALAYWNSIKIALINLVGSVLTSTMAGYAFAKIKFRGSNVVFLLYLATMMIPSQVTLIPKFVMFDKLGIMGTHLTMILPGLITITGTFLMRQFSFRFPTSFLNPRESMVRGIPDMGADYGSDCEAWHGISCYDCVPVELEQLFGRSGILDKLEAIYNTAGFD